MAVVIPSGIKDIRVRRALEELARELNTTGDTTIEVQEADPAADDPGDEGDVIYATGTGSIWVFTGTEWARSTGGNGIYVQVRAVVPENNTNYSDWVEVSTAFKNDTGANKALVATVIENGTAHTDAEMADYEFSWKRNGANFAQAALQNANTGQDKRAVIINADDVTDGGTEAFVCIVDY